MKIFISYRRTETQQEAQRIRLQLQLEFGVDSVFIDRNIPLGQEFDKHLEAELKSCDVLVAVMGNDFFRTKQKKIEQVSEEIDYVRWEIQTALQMAIPVFPIIVKKGEMPRERDLPEPLKGFAKRQALHAMDPAFESAIDQLVKALRTSGISLNPDPEPLQTETDTTKLTKQNPSALTSLPATFGLFGFRHLGLAMIVLTFVGWTIAQLAQPVEPALANVPRYFLLGLVFTTTTVSITFCPLWFYKLVNVIRARLYLNVGSFKSVVVTCSATSIWITNSVFLSLATNGDFKYTFMGQQLPIWAYILMGLLGTLWLALLAMWEVALNTKQQRDLALTVIFGSHVLNCFLQLTLLILILRYVAAGDAAILNGLLLYLTACVCGTVTLAVSWAWRGVFSTNGYWSLSFLSATLVAAWVFLTMAAYSHAFAKLVL